MKARMNSAISAALSDEMDSDSAVIVLGEDVAAAGGVFKTTEGLLDRFGPRRVRDTPISEMAFLGAGVGAAVTGLRPVVEIMFVEFLGVALDQLVTQAAKLRYLSGGQLNVPLTVRASVGAGLGFACQHSQVSANWFVGVPGLKVLQASGAQTGYDLVRSAVRDPDPVIVLEPRSLYATREELIRREPRPIASGISRVLLEGHDITVVTSGAMVGRSLDAADHLRHMGISVGVIDLLSLYPWDKETVMTLVSHTGRCVLIEEGPLSGGWSPIVADEVTTKCWERLKDAPLRITAPDTHVPFGRELEDRFTPSVDYITKMIAQFVSDGSRSIRQWWNEEVIVEAK